ncbi:hypothetical protein ACQUFY_04555 [Robbsia andropogonis]|uniref:hypothetical protein n=1 Tax=Robbsia andropogonis TaxID=28092 RepID=UPI003D227051
MNINRIQAYAEIASDVARSASNRFAAARICAKILEQHMEICELVIRVARRTAKLLDAESPFNKSRAEKIRSDATICDEHRKGMKAMQQAIGRTLINIGCELDEQLTFDAMCDLLEVNQVDRKEIRDCDYTDKRDFMTIASIFGYDHSATFREKGQQSKTGTVYWAINREVLRVMFDTPEGREASDRLWKDALAPGGLFYGLPVYYQQADGSMARKSADLTVHDSDGSRVIERRKGV